jgi:hypothetical protein
VFIEWKARPTEKDMKDINEFRLYGDASSLL